MNKLTPKDWFDKYYPVPASTMKRATMVECVQHSLTKWEGLKVAEKYDVTWDGFDLLWKDEKGRIKILEIDASSCSLCVKYLNKDAGIFNPDRCTTCPLAIVRGGVSCDSTRDNEQESPYALRVYGNSGPMIRWLKKALKYAQEQEAK